MQSDKPVTLAVITGAHGVAGEVRVKLFGEELDAYRSFNGGALVMERYRNGIARFTGIGDRNAAEALRGTELTVPRSSLPPLGEGEYYHVDLIGLTALTVDGEPLGNVVAVDNFGAGDVIEIERETGKRFMVPMNPTAVPHWDGERLTIDPSFVES